MSHLHLGERTRKLGEHVKTAYSLAIVLFALIGIFLCFVGPFKFIPEQQILIAPPYASLVDAETEAQIVDNLLLAFAADQNLKLVTPAMINDLVTTRGIELQTNRAGDVPYSEYTALAREHNVPYALFTIVLYVRTQNAYYFTLTLRETQGSEIVSSLTFRARSLDDFAAGRLFQVEARDSEGRVPLVADEGQWSIPSILPRPQSSLNLFNWLTLSFYLLHLVLVFRIVGSRLFSSSPLDAIRARLAQEPAGIFRRRLAVSPIPGQTGLGQLSFLTSSARAAGSTSRYQVKYPGDVIELLVGVGLILFLFAWLYANNANLDYVKRFIALNGGLSLAPSVDSARIEAALRYLPLILINLTAYLTHRLLPGLLPRVWSASRDRKNNLLDIVRGKTNSARQREKVNHRRLESWLVRVNQGYTQEVAGVRGFWIGVSNFRLPLTVLSAFLFAFAHPSETFQQGLAPLAWFALVPLFWVLKTSVFKHTVFYLTLFGALQAMLINYWHSTYGLIALPFLTVISGFGYFIFGIVMATLRQLVYSRKPQTLGRYDWLFWPLAWVLFDYIRSSGFAGYPWGFIGVTQYQFTPFIQIADLTGVWGVSFVLLLVNAALAHVTLPSILKSTPWNSEHRLPLSEHRGAALIAALILVATIFVYGFSRLQYFDFLKTESPHSTILLVQQNTDPRKHEPEKTLGTLQSLTAKALADLPAKPDLVAWSEAAIPYDLSQGDSVAYLQGVRNFKNFVEVSKISLLSGTVRNGTVDQAPQDIQDRYHAETPVLVERGYRSAGSRSLNFNSVALFNQQGEPLQTYDKINLVPFTEHFPYKKELPWLYAALDQFNSSDWTPGWRYTTFQTPAGTIVTPICFEDVFPDHVRQLVGAGQAQIIAVLANDYWSLTPVEGEQHFAHAMFRAIENRRPMVRATASGLTAAVAPSGRLLASLPYYTEGYLRTSVPILDPSKAQTFYGHAGDWFPLAAGVLVALAFALAAVSIRRSQKN